MLTQEHKDKIAALLNTTIDIPFVPEFIELFMFEKAVDLVDAELDQVLPDQMKSLINDLEGIDSGQSKGFADNLVKMLNKNVDVPFLSEGTEEKVFRMIVDILIKGMSKNRTLDKILTRIT